MKMTLLLYVLLSLCSLSYASEDPQVECLAKNIYFEARDQGWDGKIAVAFVTLNRVLSDRFPDTWCEVVWQSGQFEWTQDGKSDKPKERVKYSYIKDLAQDFISNYDDYQDFTNGAEYYHANYVKPCWLPDSSLTATIGDHLFYKVDPKGTSCWSQVTQR